MVSRKEALREVQKADFALQEAGLYLDGHPQCKDALDYFRYYQSIAYNARAHYENSFGPLMLQGQSGDDFWEWVNGPWPWEGEA